MRSVNKVILIGNLTRDPELRETQSGQPVTTFTVATNRVWVTKNGQRQTSTEYHDLVAWSRLAEICHKYLKKSKLVYVEGYLKTRSWDSPEGVRKFKTEVVVQDMIMLDKKQKDGEEDEVVPMDDASEEAAAPAETPAVEADTPAESTETVAETAPAAEAPATPEAAPPATTEAPAEPAAPEAAPVQTPEAPATPAATPEAAPAAPEAPAVEEKKPEDGEVSNESSVF